MIYGITVEFQEQKYTFHSIDTHFFRPYTNDGKRSRRNRIGRAHRMMRSKGKYKQSYRRGSQKSTGQSKKSSTNRTGHQKR